MATEELRHLLESKAYVTPVRFQHDAFKAWATKVEDRLAGLELDRAAAGGAVGAPAPRSDAVHNHEWKIKVIGYEGTIAEQIWPNRCELFCSGCGAWMLFRPTGIKHDMLKDTLYEPIPASAGTFWMCESCGFSNDAMFREHICANCRAFRPAKPVEAELDPTATDKDADPRHHIASVIPPLCERGVHSWDFERMRCLSCGAANERRCSAHESGYHAWNRSGGLPPEPITLYCYCGLSYDYELPSQVPWPDAAMPTETSD